MTDASSTSAHSYTEAWLPGHDSLQFYTRTYAAASPRAVLLFVHGYIEHCARYEWAHGVFASRGVSVFTFDQRGFGRTALDKEHKSKQSAYGKTSWHDQFADIEWWLKYVKKEIPGLPIFLMGQSMGGGLVLGFGTRISGPPSKDSVSLLAGVISSSPLVHQTFPAPKLLRFVGGKASALFPNLLIDAPVDANALSHDKAVNDAYLVDPLVIQKGSLKSLDDMLSGGEKLLQTDYKYWPKTLPLLITHGTADRVTSPTASKAFLDKVDVEDKEYMAFEGGFHEMANEPDGVKEKYVGAVIEWVLKHSQSVAAQESAKL